MYTVAYVILNYQTYGDTINVTDEILSFKEDDVLIVIVDNNSPNNSYQLLYEKYKSETKVRVIKSPHNSGFASGNNIGLKYLERINPLYVCIINNDIHFSRETIDRLKLIYPTLDSPAFIAPIQRLPNNIIASFAELNIPTLSYDIKTYTLFFQPKKHVYKPNYRGRNIQKVEILPGAFLFTKYETFRNLGFFDEDTFLFCEERFLGRKVKENELKNYIILDLYYLHEHSKTINKESSQKRQRGFLYDGKIKYWKRYSKHPNLVCLILAVMKNLNEIELAFIASLRPIKKLFR